VSECGERERARVGRRQQATELFQVLGASVEQTAPDRLLSNELTEYGNRTAPELALALMAPPQRNAKTSSVR